MGLHDPFEHLKHKLWSKQKPGVKLAVWFPTTKSQESTRFPCVQVACAILLESSQWELQLCFKLHLNRKFSHKIMAPQNCKSHNFGNFEIPIWESRDKMPFGCGPCEEHIVHYKGEGGAFPQVRAVVNLVSSNLPMVRLSTKSATSMH
jgi:hypothetical protein